MEYENLAGWIVESPHTSTMVPARKQTDLRLTDNDRTILNKLLGYALFDPDLADALLNGCLDSNFVAQFDLRDHIQYWLRGLQVSTLQQLAQVIIYHP